MDRKRVKDLMIPLEECPVVDNRATLADALQALDLAQKRLASGRQPYRAVLVKDPDGKVVGKLGQWAFLMALEPKYAVHKDLGRLSRAGVDPELVAAMMHHYQSFQDSLSDLCLRASRMAVSEVMRPVEDSIDEDAPLNQAIHKLVLSQTLSVLVTRGSKVVGLIRLSDLFDEVAKEMKHSDVD